eukprot:750746-Hanusia_phi.AAC.3
MEMMLEIIEMKMMDMVVVVRVIIFTIVNQHHPFIALKQRAERAETCAERASKSEQDEELRGTRGEKMLCRMRTFLVC